MGIEGERSRVISKLNSVICIKHNTLISSFLVMKRSSVSSSVESQVAAYLSSELSSRLLKVAQKNVLKACLSPIIQRPSQLEQSRSLRMIGEGISTFECQADASKLAWEGFCCWNKHTSNCGLRTAMRVERLERHSAAAAKFRVVVNSNEKHSIGEWRKCSSICWEWSHFNQAWKLFSRLFEDLKKF